MRSVFMYLQEYGFWDFLLPALLIFTVMFAVLQKVPLFQKPKKKPIMDAQRRITGWEEEKYPADYAVEALRGKTKMVGDRKINSILAIVVALAVTIPHAVGLYPPDMDPITLISSFLPHTAVVLVACFAVILLLGLAGGTIPNAALMLIALLAAGFLVVIFLMNIFPNWIPTLWWLHDPATQAIIITLLTAGLVGYWIIKPEGGEEMPKKLKRWMMEKVP